MARSGTHSFADLLLGDYLARPRRAEDADISPSMLFLSGGSQHGAFGAGFLSGWAAQRPGGLPRFRTVSGISTGAIMATHAFLNRTDDIIQRYSITHEREILNAYVGQSGLGKLGDALTVIKRGAVGDLTPMRSLLGQTITDEVLRAVADEADAGRNLYVGAVDVDLGKAAIFDLTALAARFKRMQDAGARPEQLQHVRDCYLNTIVASSSVPLAAPPTFIDNRMYIDGGARFGVISDEIEQAARALAAAFDANMQSEALAPNVYIIINGDLETKVECGKADKALCSSQPPFSPIGRHADWTLPDLAQRSVSILINQVYRFSADRIHDRAQNRDYQVHMARIEPDLAEFKTDVPFPDSLGVVQACPVWEDVDAKLEAPLEFHPRYMRCLIKYGAGKAKAKNWACFDPPSSARASTERADWARLCPKGGEQ